MPKLSDVLSNYATNDDKLDFMYNLFLSLSKEVNSVLIYGACNTDVANRASTVYCYRQKKRGSTFSCAYTKEEKQVLPAVIANFIKLKDSFRSSIDAADERFRHYFTMSYLYGTGTCELFSIVGAYYLAQRYNVNLSIETIYSTESHTYIRVHTEPEFIMDFWGAVCCEYNDTTSWKECHGSRYARDTESTVKTDLILNQMQLLTMGAMVFTPSNESQRQKITARVSDLLHHELQVTSPYDKIIDLNAESITARG